MNRFLTTLLIALGTSCSNLAAQTVYSTSLEELKAKYQQAIGARSPEAAWRLFCQAPTPDRIIEMYRRSVDRTIREPVESIEFAPLDPSRQLSPHSVNPLGRMIFTYDESKRSGDFVVSNFFYYGRSALGYCLGMPALPAQ
jgi:hypothetical protein